ncbi:hypothetical protein MHUMG1_06587 [Metarhizium humberi]|uniref:Uncharacterized protein n=1 Tax=Metarhizium humberi TaxID=2596975 RepID=A0A9P8S626_9HYPO|nr:hypothetical protein MHUMG1_06587 [Metarhizium humberi]
MPQPQPAAGTQILNPALRTSAAVHITTNSHDFFLFSKHNRQQEPVDKLALAVPLSHRNSRHQGRAHPLVPPNPRHQAPLARDAVLAVLDHALHRVVDVDRAAASRQPHRPVKVVGLPAPVGVDKDEVEDAPLGRQPRQHVERVAEHHLGAVHAGRAQVLERHVAVPGVDLDAGHARPGPREPLRRVAAQRADLEHRPRRDQLRQEREVLPVQGGDADRGQPVPRRVGQRGGELGVVADEPGLGCAFDEG